MGAGHNDDDFCQAGILVRKFFTDPQRFKPVEQVAGSRLGGMRASVLNLDIEAGQRIDNKALDGHASKPSDGW